MPTKETPRAPTLGDDSPNPSNFRSVTRRRARGVRLSHDVLCRLAVRFLDAEPSCGLPSGAAMLAFVQHSHLGREDADTLARILRVMRAVEANSKREPKRWTR